LTTFLGFCQGGPAVPGIPSSAQKACDMAKDAAVSRTAPHPGPSYQAIQTGPKNIGQQTLRILNARCCIDLPNTLTSYNCSRNDPVACPHPDTSDPFLVRECPIECGGFARTRSQQALTCVQTGDSGCSLWHNRASSRWQWGSPIEMAALWGPGTRAVVRQDERPAIRQFGKAGFVGDFSDEAG
jgi:hypothetical protein